MPDAVVIGSGPNGLVAANLLADAGWEVLVLEAEPEPGGAVRSGVTAAEGYTHDRFSAFYPLSAASPVLRAMNLHEHGLNWIRHPIVVAHPGFDESLAVLSLDLDETCASLDAFARGDGDEWRRLYAWWRKVGPQFVRAVLQSPFPPIRPGLRLARSLGGVPGLLDFARFGFLPVRRFAQEHFHGEGAARLLAGNALHADVAPETPGSALFAMTLVGSAQAIGFPVPEGGAGNLTASLVRRLESKGGRVECDARVTRVLVRRRRAVGVRTIDGREIDARRAVLADCGAPQLFLELLDPAHVPSRMIRGIERFQYDNGTVKVDWALDGPIPWARPEVYNAGTVHITEGMDALTIQSAELARGEIPARPFLVLGQYASADPSRAPGRGEAAWAYTHIPQQVRGDAGPDNLSGRWDADEVERFVGRMEDQVERVAPGFRDRIVGRYVMAPNEMQRQDSNLVSGALNGGTAQLHQQLFLRPVPGLGRPETPVAGLYLASSSAHPGGGVHGGPGANAAKAALKEPALVQALAARLAAATVGGGQP